MGGINTGGAGGGGRAAILALIGALLAGGSIDKVSTSAGAGQGNIIMVCSSHTSKAFCRISRIANVTVKSTAGVTLEGLCSVQVKTTLACTCTVVGVVNQTSIRVTVYTHRGVVLHIHTS